MLRFLKYLKYVNGEQLNARIKCEYKLKGQRKVLYYSVYILLPPQLRPKNEGHLIHRKICVAPPHPHGFYLPRQGVGSSTPRSRASDSRGERWWQSQQHQPGPGPDSPVPLLLLPQAAATPSTTTTTAAAPPSSLLLGPARSAPPPPGARFRIIHGMSYRQKNMVCVLYVLQLF